MSVNVETLEKNLVKLTVEVPVEDVEKSDREGISEREE